MTEKLNLVVFGLAHLPTAEHAADLPDDLQGAPLDNCAYTTKTARFIRMMKERGHNVIFVGLEGSNTKADEHITVLSEEDRNKVYGPLEQFRSRFFKHDGNDDAYKTFKKNALAALRKDLPEKAIICNTMGNYYQDLVRSLNGIRVESGIGYYGIIPECFHVFESRTWQSHVYGVLNWPQGPTMNGRTPHYDTAIYNFYDPAYYQQRKKSREDFLLMVCRNTQLKGLYIGQAVAEAYKMKLVIAGQPGEIKIDSPYVEQLGVISEEQKLDLMSRARAILCPTLYMPPFEGVHAEAMLMGCPPITTDWGVFTETIMNGVNGFRCDVLKQFVEAVKKSENLDPRILHRMAVDMFSMENIGKQYEDYFYRLMDLYGDGWYTL